MARTTQDVCQDCWQDDHPTEYAPVMTRDGECAKCGNYALVIRDLIVQPSREPIKITSWTQYFNERS